MSDKQAIADRLEKLHTALLADAMDQLGFFDSGLGIDIRPSAAGQRLIGTAMTMRCEALDEPRPEPYAHLMAAFRDIEPGDVVVLECADRHSAMWGELLSVGAMVRGAVGAVMDGATRDVDQTIDLGFPIFSNGFSPIDSSGRQEVVEHGVLVQCGNAEVRPGDWIVGDIMGAIVIPADLILRALDLAEGKEAGESTVRAEIARGDDIDEVFARYGIL